MSADRIRRLEVWTCPLPLAHVLNLGPIRYETRDYVVLRLTTEDGAQGSAVGYTRNTPLAEAVAALAPQLADLGTDPEAVQQALKARNAPGWPGLVRAATLIDIALWDVRARRTGQSLAGTFGPADRDVPLMAVAGYFLDQRPRGEILDEVVRFVDDGYETIKLIIPGHDLATDLRLVDEIRALLPDAVGLAVDFHGAFSDVDAAVAYCTAFSNRDLRFVEDPFPSFETGKFAQAARRLPTPVAAGEDAVSENTYDELIRGGVGYLRLDVTSSGGYTTGLRGLALAEQHGRWVAPHIWPHMHMPLAQSLPQVVAVEVIPDHVGADPFDLVLAEPLPITRGRWRVPTASGLYLPLDWDAVAARASTSWQTLVG